MGIEEDVLHGSVFKKKSEKQIDNEKKVKTKASKSKYIHGLHGSDSAKMKEGIRTRRANRHKNKNNN